jgi:AcrR family transcriptional regulator
MNKDGGVKRSYQSPLRQAQARTTRAAVIRAAARLFAEHGYVATSIDDIAAAAGVSRATVFSSVGGKPVLLKTAFDVAIVGDDEPVSLPDRPRSKAIREEPDQRRYLALYAALVTEMWVRLGGIYEAVRGAASADPEARELWEAHQGQRRVGAANVVGDLLRKGSLRDGLEERAAADVVWVLNDPGLYHQLVDRQGWTAKRFEEWLAESMGRLLLPDQLPSGQPAG